MSSGRPSTDSSFQSLYDSMEHGRFSSCSDFEYRSFDAMSSYSNGGQQSLDFSSQQPDFCSLPSHDEGGRISISSLNTVLFPLMEQ